MPSHRAPAVSLIPEALSQWRHRVLQRMFLYVFVFLAGLLCLELANSVRTGHWHALPALSVAVVLQGVAALAQRSPVLVRAVAFTLASCVGIGIGIPVVGFGLPLPFVFGMMTITLLAVCVGRQFAFVSLTAIVVVILGAAYYVCFVAAEPPLEATTSPSVLDSTTFPNWLRVVGGFALASSAVIFSIGSLFRRLEQAVERKSKLLEILKRESQDKIQALEARERMTEQLRRSSELHALGMLAAGVAHDFNNLLVVIMANSSALKEEASGVEREMLEEVEQASEQAADLCRRLLTLGRERVSKDEKAELNALIEADLPLVRRLMSSRVEVHWRPGPELWFRAAKVEFRQLLLNLCANARDAMPDGGELTISTSVVTRTRPNGTTPQTFALLSVADQGTGMDDETITRLFEPFFTTKANTTGTGLGMAVVAAAVEQHKALIEVSSTLGKGTTICILLPTVDPPAEQDVVGNGLSPRELTGKERVLVVDDDERVVRTVRRSLESHGYTVLSASDGSKALQALSHSTVDLVISDVSMPNMGGLQLLERVHRDYPQVAFMLCSAVPAGSAAEHFMLEAHLTLLPKPFSEATLLTKVRELLMARLPAT